MPAWLTKAKIGRRVPQSDQPYEVPCACGAAVRGRRAPMWQIVKCPECGLRVFVLPADVYPGPRPRPVEGAVIDAPARRTLARRMLGAAGRPAKAVAERLSGPLRRVRAQFTPFRLVLLGIAGAIGGTLYVVTSMQGHEQARVDLQTTPARASAALDSGDLVEATALYRLAADAVRLLGRSDVESRHVLQMAAELEVLEQLAPNSIDEMIQHAAAQPPTQPGQPENLLSAQNRNTWIVIDGNVARVTTRRGSPAEIDYPLVVEERTVDFAGFDHLLELKDGSIFERVIVAGKLLKIGRTPGRWTVTVDAKSAFLWCDPRTCHFLGLEGATPEEKERLGQLLAEQSKRMGVVP